MELSQNILKIRIKRLTQKFLTQRDKIKKEFLTLNKSLKCCKENSKSIDKLILNISEIKKFFYQKLNIEFSICAVGGYGRGILAPYSDLDLLFIFQINTNPKHMQKIVEFILFPLWDLGFKIGYAVRTVEESIILSRKDHVIQTSMLDTRLICGSKRLFNDLIQRFSIEVSKNGLKLLRNKLREREKRIIEVGNDYFKNEPNLKDSEGSLRDINLIFWGLNVFNYNNKESKNKSNTFFSLKEKRVLESSLEFLLLLRCHLHYQSDRTNDNLSFDYQQTIARLIYNSSKPKKNYNPNFFVEKMMKDFFKHIKNTKNLTEIFSQIIERAMKEKHQEIFIPKEKPKLMLQVFLDRLYKGIDDANDKRMILEFLGKSDKTEILNAKNISLFKKIFFSLDKKKLVILFDLGVISKLIPEFSKISYLPQFDRFHSLSVGQHTLKAVNILKDLKEEKIKKKTYTFSYNEIKKKFNLKALYYATLFHDIGKGRGGQHNKRGAKIAKDIVLRFGENIKTAEDTFWLVKNHSLLSDVAFKKDFQDHSVIRNASEKIENIPRLRALFLLTVTDISAVEKGLWNNWKSTLLQQLFLKLERQIKYPEKIIGLNKRIEKIKENILKNSRKISNAKLDDIARISYPNYWLLQSEKMITFQIENFFLKKTKSFNFVIRKEENNFFDLILVTKDRPKLFLNLISIFVSESLSIFEARIFTLDDGTVIDTFKLSFNENQNYSKEDRLRTLDSLKEKIKNLGDGKEFMIKNDVISKVKIFEKKIDVHIDNNSSATYSILIVKTNNRPKLLYDISNILIKNKIVISMAKISTNGDFVEDSFHLRTEYSSKIQNKNAIKKIKNEIIDKLNHNLSNVI